MGRGTFATLMALLVGLIQVDIVAAQQAEQLKPGVVKITAKAQGVTKVGTGFIVRLENNAAYIVTAAHVVAGDAQPKVEYLTKRNVPVPAEVLGLEGGDYIRGLALLVVKGQENQPNGLTALPLASAIASAEGMDIMVIGFPRSQGRWAVAKGNISSRQGRDLYFSPAVDEGYSGGPIIQSGKVIGMVLGTSQTGRGVTARSVQDYIEGFGITPQESAALGTAEKAQETKPPTVAKVLPAPSLPIKPEGAQSNEDDEMKTGVVQITARVGGIQRTGTGIIVALRNDAAYIVTASHVVEGDPLPQVAFFVDSYRSFDASIRGRDSQNPKGLAALIVRGPLPPGLRALGIEAARVKDGEGVTIIGFPRVVGVPWLVTDGKIAGRKGPELVFTGNADEGNSGGPLMINGKVVGVVTSVTGGFGYASPSTIVLETLRGWNVPVERE